MPRYKKVYESHAKTYEALVYREDFQGNILPAIERISPLAQKEVVEFGAGTGRLTRLIAPRCKFIHAFDAYPAMIDEGRARLGVLGIENVSWRVGENRAIPVEDASADLTIAGWTFGHCTSWYPDAWKEHVASAVKEMERISRPSGFAIILETLGTGHELPVEPNERLFEYYSFLEREFGFARNWIRTDYRFDSKEQADALTEAFFGKRFPLLMEANGGAILRECTGIWHCQF
ncbi:MAG: hypothetical protein A2X94_06700 [Bdellovibrionales bacterium GWB1_55_8]|nr:MAG: hypothetical protein A2X94_06700 [Bdellovibrionales bacterium GWB1_55_8]